VTGPTNRLRKDRGQLRHALGITSVYLQGIDSGEIIESGTPDGRR